MWSFLPVISYHWFIARRSFRKIVISTSQLHYFMLHVSTMYLAVRTESRYTYKRQFGPNS